MRSSGLIALLCVCAGCVSNAGERSVQVVAIHGHPGIEIRLPAHILYHDLEALEPPIEVRGPAGMRVTCVIFGDTNNDAAWTEDEPARRCFGRPTATGVLVDRVFVTRDQLTRLGPAPRLGLVIEEGGQRHFFSQALE